MIEPFDKSQLDGTGLYMDLVPYSIGKKELYTAEELYGPDNYDENVYKFYIQKGKQVSETHELLARSIHDFCIRKALEDYIDTKDKRRIVGVMGGHNMLRTDSFYKQIVLISKELTEQGFLMISGGGPGAMEATHVGAWMAGRTTKEVDAALEMLYVAPEYKDKGWMKSAMCVKEKFPQKDYESLSIPTWLYGHEPSTPFATHIAKLFDNSIREDAILTLSVGGIIFTPGSAGTMQEIFQEAVQNHYMSFGISSPMVFMGTEFWSIKVPVYTLMYHLQQTGVYNNLKLTLTDSSEKIVNTLTKEDTTLQ